MHEAREEQKSTKIFGRVLTNKFPKSPLRLQVSGGMHVLNRGQGQGRQEASGPGHREDQHKSPHGGGGILPEAQHPSSSAQCKKTETGYDLSPTREVSAPFVLTEPVRN